jgi:hypothetical protein
VSQPKGIGLYLRAVAGPPAPLVKLFKDHHVHWMAIGGPWHDSGGQRLINSADTCRRYSEAFEAAGIHSYVWGYPWQGTESRFLDQMQLCASFKRWLLDPELGINPVRRSIGPAWNKAVTSARLLVGGAKARANEVGMSTFGIPPKWFPVDEFTPCDWGGGQTYTKNGLIARSLRLFRSKFAITIPNFGLYLPKPKVEGEKQKYRSKTPHELDTHLQIFLDESQNSPSFAMIGWAENFMKANLWPVLARFAEKLESL